MVKLSSRVENVDMIKLNEDMYTVLMDKTEGEAWTSVKAVVSGSGLEAYMKLYKWFTGTTGLGITEKARRVMSPTPPKSEADMAEAVDKWIESERVLASHKGYNLDQRLKVTALKMLMVGRARDHFEQWEVDYDPDKEGSWRILVNKVQEYATRRRLEANIAKGKGNAMDVDGVAGEAEEQWGEW